MTAILRKMAAAGFAATAFATAAAEPQQPAPDLFPDAVFTEEFVQGSLFTHINACLADGHLYKILGIPMISKTDLDRLGKTQDDLDMQAFSEGLRAAVITAAKEHTIEEFQVASNVAGFNAVGRAMDRYYRDMNIKTGVTMYAIPVAEMSDEPNESCPVTKAPVPRM